MSMLDILFDASLVFMPIALLMVAFADHRLWQVAAGLVLYIVAFVVLMLALGLAGCALGAPRQAPGHWDANLRYELTHPVR